MRFSRHAACTGGLAAGVKALSVLLAVFLIGFPASAELRLAQVFGDRMVLQRGEPVTVWGWADPRQSVLVQFGETQQNTRADADGLWTVQLPAMAGNFDGRDLVVTAGNESITKADILVGEVWLVSGQSNMEYGAGHDTEWPLEGPSADYPAIRYTHLPSYSATEPQDDLPSSPRWMTLAKGERDIGRVSGVGYHFGVALRRYLDVPVGIINNAWGGTTAEAWTSRETLLSLPRCRELVAQWDLRIADWPNEKARRETAHAEKVKEAEAKDERPPGLRLNPPDTDRNNPGGCYNASIVPIARLTFKGALFYQGENNCFGKWGTYQESFPKVITDWRSAFGRDDLPFGIISLTGWGPSARDTDPEFETVRRNSYAYIRDTHFVTHRTVPGTGLIVNADLGDADNIHPHRKREIGKRAARWALAQVYGEAIVHTAPTYREMETRGSRIVLHFDYDPQVDMTGPWYLTCPITRAGAYRGFMIAGEDRHWHPAQARRIDKEHVLEVWSDLVPEPVAVRYGFAHYPDGNVIGIDHLPMAPFRTDDWPLPPAEPADPEARPAWDSHMRELEQNAQRQAKERKLREAKALVEKLERELSR